jgi:simple sugar transport system permease protein
MDPVIILHAGIAIGTVLLFATIGEIFTERSGIMNLGLEGMMLIGAMAAFSVTVATGNGWLGIVVAMLAGGALSLLHGLVTIHFQAESVPSSSLIKAFWSMWVTC